MAAFFGQMSFDQTGGAGVLGSLGEKAAAGKEIDEGWNGSQRSEG